MNQRAWILLVLIAGCTSTPQPHDPPASVAAPSFETGPGPYSLDWDVTSGRYRETSLHVPGRTFTVKGLIQFAGVASNRKWAPMASVDLMGPTESYEVGFEAFVLDENPGKIQFALRNGLFGTVRDVTFAQADFSDKWTPFELKLYKTGELNVSVAGDTGANVSVRPFEITRVRVLVSTGHVRFSNITITASGE